MDLELLTKPREGYHLVKRHRGSFVEFELQPIGFSGYDSWSAVGHPVDTIFMEESLPGIGAEAGNHLALEDGNVSQGTSDSEAQNPLGSGGEVGQNLGESSLPWDEPLRLYEIRTHFEATTPKLKPRTRQEYWKQFRAFALKVRLEEYTRRDLDGKKGEELLLRYFGMVKDSTPHSLLTIMSGVRKVWKRGLDLPWDLESDDLPDAPMQRIIPGPRREAVEPWVHAIQNEWDPYLRSWLMCQFTFGLRALNQQSALRREHIVYNEATGKPIGFVANGTDANFKRDSYLIAAIPPMVAEALAEWLKVHPDASPEAYIWPWLGIDGNLDPSKPMTAATIDSMRHNFAKRWHLAWIPSKMVRKFVKATLISSGMREPEKSYWQGHSPKVNDMDVVYGTRQWDEIFTEQLVYMPEGPLGTFSGVKANVEVPPELAGLWAKVASGEVNSLDAMDAFKAILKASDRRQVAADLLKP